jgi:hypothetical protein
MKRLLAALFTLVTLFTLQNLLTPAALADGIIIIEPPMCDPACPVPPPPPTESI